MTGKPIDVEVVDEKALAIASKDTTPTAIQQLLTLAVEKGVTVEALEKLVTLHERVSDRQAASEFAAALADFQRECPPIKRAASAKIATKGGAQFSYTYAPLDEIARTVGPLLHERGLSYTWDSDVKDRMLCAICTLRHVNGHSVTASFTAPTETSAGMSEQQKFAAALTFARRQSLVQVLGLTTTDEDTDAKPTERITEERAASLEALITEVEADRAKFLKYLGVSDLAELLAADYAGAVRALEQKRKARP